MELRKRLALADIVAVVQHNSICCYGMVMCYGKMTVSG